MRSDSVLTSASRGVPAAGAFFAATLQEVRSSDIKYQRNASGAQIKLGGGNFGDVFKGRYEGAPVAIKQLRIETMSETDRAAFRSEATVHARMRHPNIVNLLALCLEEGHFALVLEYMEGGSLYQLLHSEIVLPWNQRIDMAMQLVAGVMYLHGLRDHIVHRDLKSANVLLESPYNEHARVKLRIGDFGLAKIKDASSSTSGVGVAGTIVSSPPEAFDDTHVFTKKSDIYSLGVLLWEIASRALPYAGLSMAALMRRILGGQTNPIPAGTPPEFASVIQDCWKLEPTERPDARSLLPRLEVLAGFFAGRERAREREAAAPGAGAGSGMRPGSTY